MLKETRVIFQPHATDGPFLFEQTKWEKKQPEKFLINMDLSLVD